MTEAFLHHLWKYRLFDQRNLATSDGEPIEVIKVGQHNTDAGPDFFNAQLRIGSTSWAGNVEIHLKSSDWNRHQHTRDAAYNNVILHVVHEHDEEVFTNAKEKIVTLGLKGRFNPALFETYRNLLESDRWIPCANHVGKVDEFSISGWLERMLIERLEIKTSQVTASLKQNKNDWDETFYHHLAKNFGFKTNSLPFEMLAKSLPLPVLARHKDHLNQLEALLFGQAGLLEKKINSGYPGNLKREYNFLRKKFSLTPMDASQWKFLRLRPSNFPTVRIAQFARLMHTRTGIFSKILNIENIRGLQSLFSVSASGYWLSHYTFGKPSRKIEKALGEEATRNILVNTVVPFVFAYGRHRNEEDFRQRALKLLEALPPEKNGIIAGWEKAGITSRDAGRTQALLHLKNEYCNGKKCLFCGIGNKIINSIS
jgi:hypothetical protein